MLSISKFSDHWSVVVYVYVICRLGGPYSEKLWPRSWKCCGWGQHFQARGHRFSLYGPTLRAGSHFDISISISINISIRKICVNRGYISMSISISISISIIISISTRYGTFSIFLCLCLCLCCEYLSVNRAYISISVSIKSFLVSGIQKNKIQVRSVRICQLKTWRRRWTKSWRNLSAIILHGLYDKNRQTLILVRGYNDYLVSFFS